MESEVVREAVAPAAPAVTGLPRRRRRSPAVRQPGVRRPSVRQPSVRWAKLPLPAPAAAELRPAQRASGAADAYRGCASRRRCGADGCRAASRHRECRIAVGSPAILTRPRTGWTSRTSRTSSRCRRPPRRDQLGGCRGRVPRRPRVSKAHRPPIEEVEIVGIGTAPRLDVPHRLVVADAETATTGASAPANAAPPARFIGTRRRLHPAVLRQRLPTRPVEISIGAIHVRVDAPVPQAPAAPAPAAHMSSARSAAVWAVAAALRRF